MVVRWNPNAVTKINPSLLYMYAQKLGNTRLLTRGLKFEGHWATKAGLDKFYSSQSITRHAKNGNKKISAHPTVKQLETLLFILCYLNRTCDF